MQKGPSFEPQTEKPIEPIPLKGKTTTNTAEEEKERLKKNKAIYQKRYLQKKKDEKKQTIFLNDQGEPLSINMKYQPSSQQMANAERDPITALLTLVTNTGLGRFADTAELIDNWPTAAASQPSQNPPDYFHNLRKEISDNITEEDGGKIVANFLESWNIEAKLFACASCGVKQFEMGNALSHSVPLHELKSLIMSDDKVVELNNILAEYR